MLHEILLAALGYPGDLVDENFQVRRSLVPNLISFAEAELIDGIAELGRYCSSLVNFTEVDLVSRSNGIRMGLVSRAMGNGISELLRSYREEVCKIEQSILDDPSMPLTRIRYLLRDYELLLPVAHGIIQDIQDQELSGGQILAMLHRRKVKSGVPRTCQLLDRLLYHGHVVLYNMLEHWMLRGILRDPYDEFFVVERVRNVVYPYTDTGESTSVSSEEVIHRSEYEWKSQLSLRIEMLPSSYLRPETAAKIMFIGKSMRVLCVKGGAASQPVGNSLGSTDGKSNPMYDNDINITQHANALQNLRRKQVFDITLFEHTIDSIYWSIAKRLWSLVVVEAQLMDHLGFLRDFFFLGRGEFFSFFIQSGRELFATPPSRSLAHSEAAVRNGPWRDAAAQCDLDEYAGDDDFQESEFAQTQQQQQTKISPAELFSRIQVKLTRPRFDFSKAGFVSPEMSHVQENSSRNPQLLDVYLVGQARSAIIRPDQFNAKTIRATVPTTTTQNLGRIPISSRAQHQNTSRSVVDIIPPSSTAQHKTILTNEQPFWDHSVLGDSVTATGACWHGEKVQVDQGFDAEVAFQMATSLGLDSQIAFVVHNSPEIGPTALGRSFSPRNVSKGLVQDNDMWIGGSFHGIPNSVAVCVHHTASGRCTVGVYTMGQGENRGTLEATIASVEVALNESENSGPSLDNNVASTDKEQNVPDHVLSIKYDLEGGDVATTAPRKSEKPYRVLRVYLDGSQVLFCRLELAQTLVLDSGISSAWIGVCGSNGRLGANDSTRTHRGLVRMLNWWFSAHATGSKSYDYDPWRHCLSLKMVVPWPLHLVITQESLASYNIVFQFLLAVKRVGDCLKSSWASLVQLRFKKHDIDPDQHARLMMLWRLRASMAFFVDNLQYHLQVDVIDSLFEQLQDKIKQSSDFDSVIRAHKEFVAGVVTRSFLHNKVVLNGLDSILRTCLRFCSLAERFSVVESAASSFVDDAIEQTPSTNNLEELDQSISNLSDQYSHDIKFLFTILKRLNSSLLLRIDFNGHFTALTKDLGVRYKYHANKT